MNFFELFKLFLINKEYFTLKNYFKLITHPHITTNS